jgi:hypothetical protein
MPTNEITLGARVVGTLCGPPDVTGGHMVAAMVAVGVDGATLVSPFSMYRYDAAGSGWVEETRP